MRGILSSIAGAIFNGLGGTTFERTETHSVDAGDCSHLAVENTNGNVVVESQEGRETQINATKKVKTPSEKEGQVRLDQLKVAVSKEGTTIRVVTDISELSPKRNYSVNYEIQAPRNLSLSVEQKNGNVRVLDRAADVQVADTNGNIQVSQVEGSINLRTTNGNVSAQDTKGTMNARTTNGNIGLNGTAGHVDASTKNGNIGAEVLPSSEAIEVDLRTTNRNIQLGLGKEISARMIGSVTNGTIRCDFPLEIASQSRTRLKGTTRTGEGEVQLKTVNGNITLRSLD